MQPSEHTLACFIKQHVSYHLMINLTCLNAGRCRFLPERPKGSDVRKRDGVCESEQRTGSAKGITHSTIVAANPAESKLRGAATAQRDSRPYGSRTSKESYPPWKLPLASWFTGAILFGAFQPIAFFLRRSHA